jgi:hypothetical protein
MLTDIARNALEFATVCPGGRTAMIPSVPSCAIFAGSTGSFADSGTVVTIPTAGPASRSAFAGAASRGSWTTFKSPEPSAERASMSRAATSTSTVATSVGRALRSALAQR